MGGSGETVVEAWHRPLSKSHRPQVFAKCEEV